MCCFRAGSWSLQGFVKKKKNHTDISFIVHQSGNICSRLLALCIKKRFSFSFTHFFFGKAGRFILNVAFDLVSFYFMFCLFIFVVLSYFSASPSISLLLKSAPFLSFASVTWNYSLWHWYCVTCTIFFNLLWTFCSFSVRPLSGQYLPLYHNCLKNKYSWP